MNILFDDFDGLEGWGWWVEDRGLFWIDQAHDDLNWLFEEEGLSDEVSSSWERVTSKERTQRLHDLVRRREDLEALLSIMNLVGFEGPLQVAARALDDRAFKGFAVRSGEEEWSTLSLLEDPLLTASQPQHQSEWWRYFIAHHSEARSI